KQTFEPWRSEAKNIFTSELPPFFSFLRQKAIAAFESEFGQVLINFPLGDGIMVGPPLRFLEIDVRSVELIPHHLATEVVLLESRDGFKQGPWELPDAALL